MWVDLIKEMRTNGLNVDCVNCNEPVSKRFFPKVLEDGFCPDCRKFMRNLPEKPLTIKEFMEETK